MRLMDCFIQVLAYTESLCRDGGEGPAAEDVAADYETLWREADALGRSMPREDYQSAKFAVCAFVDEAVLNSNWEGRLGWRPFQRLYFKTMNGGEEFYHSLERIPPGNKELAEVYGVCLAMGFTGRYFDHDQEEREELVDANRSRLELEAPEALESEDFCPEAYPAGMGGSRKRVWGRMSLLTIVLALAPPALFITLFALFRYSLGRVIFEFFTQAG